MAQTIDAKNTRASKAIVIGWVAGLAYFVWWGDIEASFWANIVLVAVGVFVSSIVLGGAVAMVMGVMTRMTTRSQGGSTNFLPWGVFISPVVAFFVSKPVALLVTGWF
jgi:hypothetical protein